MKGKSAGLAPRGKSRTGMWWRSNIPSLLMSWWHKCAVFNILEGGEIPLNNTFSGHVDSLIHRVVGVKWFSASKLNYLPLSFPLFSWKALTLRRVVHFFTASFGANIIQPFLACFTAARKSQVCGGEMDHMNLFIYIYPSKSPPSFRLNVDDAVKEIPTMYFWRKYTLVATGRAFKNIWSN